MDRDGARAESPGSSSHGTCHGTADDQDRRLPPRPVRGRSRRKAGRPRHRVLPKPTSTSIPPDPSFPEDQVGSHPPFSLRPGSRHHSGALGLQHLRITDGEAGHPLPVQNFGIRAIGSFPPRGPQSRSRKGRRRQPRTGGASPHDGVSRGNGGSDPDAALPTSTRRFAMVRCRAPAIGPYCLRGSSGTSTLAASRRACDGHASPGVTIRVTVPSLASEGAPDGEMGVDGDHRDVPDQRASLRPATLPEVHPVTGCAAPRKTTYVTRDGQGPLPIAPS